MDSKIRNSYANNLKHTVSGKTLGQQALPRPTHSIRHNKLIHQLKNQVEANFDKRRPCSLKTKKKSHNKKPEGVNSNKQFKQTKINNVSLKSGKDHKPSHRKQQNLTTVASEGKISTEVLLRGRKSVRKFQPRNTQYVRQDAEDLNSEYRPYHNPHKSRKVAKEFRTTAKCKDYQTGMDNSVELAKKEEIIKNIDKIPSKTKHSKGTDTAESVLLDCLENIEPMDKNNDKHSTKDSKNESIVRIAIKSSTKIGNMFANQPEVNAKMRAILIDWLFRISSEMAMQREAVHLAIVYLDSYTTKVEIAKDQYQLFGLAGLLIGYKQEFSHHEQFLQILTTSCDNGYTQEQILEAERKMAFALNFRLNPTTHNFWVEYFTLRWDRFLQKGEYYIQPDTEAQSLKSKPILFRRPTARSYNLYRQILQLVDTSLYCETSVRMFDRARLVIGGIYLILRMEYECQCKFERMLIDGQCNKFMQMFNEFNKKITPIFRDRFGFNEVFNEYLTELCDFELADIIGEIKYLAGYLNMAFIYELPENLCSAQDITYDQFTRYQVYTEGSLQTALTRL